MLRYHFPNNLFIYTEICMSNQVAKIYDPSILVFSQSESDQMAYRFPDNFQFTQSGIPLQFAMQKLLSCLKRMRVTINLVRCNQDIDDIQLR